MMRNPFAFDVGGVVSADIAVPDHEREVAFYSKVLTAGDSPLWQEDLLNNLGTPVIGLGPRMPEYEAIPVQWMPHFQVADVAVSASNAIELGGNELMHAKGDDGESQWAVLMDSVGAAFGVIPVVPGEPEKTPQHERFGYISWLSLTVADAARSREFYERVVGWTGDAVEAEGDARFEMQNTRESVAAEICQSGDDQEMIPSVWIIYLPVADLAASLAFVSDGGGSVVAEFPNTKSAVVRDPIGVHFGLQAG